jgi:hypothetical protein
MICQGGTLVLEPDPSQDGQTCGVDGVCLAGQCQFPNQCQAQALSAQSVGATISSSFQSAGPENQCEIDPCRAYLPCRPDLYRICRNLAPLSDCVRSCLQERFHGCFYRDIEPLLGPNVHLRCVARCTTSGMQ